MSQGYALLAFILLSLVLGVGLLFGGFVLRVRQKKADPLKRATYECGESPTGVAWVRFHARYYVVALFFVLFDIEAAFLLPWATIVREVGAKGLVAVFSFVGILMLGWLWAVRKGALEWQ